MTDSHAETLRCPIDPTRSAALERDQQSLVCARCRVRFPVKLGVPVLLADEADYPTGTRSPETLPCRRGNRPRG